MSRPSNALVVARTPRETGFGDFCFGRILRADRMKDKRWEYIHPVNILHGTALEKCKQFEGHSFKPKDFGEWTEEDFAANSHNTPVAELDGYVRKGTFEFEKLPPEIRHRILRLLLEPLYQYDSVSQRNLVQFSIRSPPRDLSWYFDDNDVLEYLRKWDALEDEAGAGNVYGLTVESDGKAETGDVFKYPAYLDSLPPAEKTQIMERYECLKKSHAWEFEMHPERSADYIMLAMVQKPQSTPRVKAKKASRRRRRRITMEERFDDLKIEKEQKYDFHMLKLVQQLSNLSNGLRQDLGTVIWAHTKFHISGKAALGPGLLSCLMDRPAILRGVGYISLDIPCEDLGKEEQEYLTLTCRYLSRHIALDHLQITVFAETYTQRGNESLEHLCNGTGIFAGLKLIRLIPVSKSFEVRFPDGIEYYYMNRDVGLKEEYIRRMQELMLPNTLRAKGVNATKQKEKKKKNKKTLK